MVQETNPRFEFRVFGLHLEKLQTELEKITPRLLTRKMDSIYLLTAGNTKNNVKIREGIMDIKVLEQEMYGLEQWNPYLVGEFPLKSDVIKNVVFPALGIVCPVLERADYTLEQFLGEIISVDPDLSVAFVNKVRHGYTLNECITEIAEVIVNGALINTLCIESENPEKVLAAKKKIGISNQWENVNYPLALKRIMGLADLPRERR
jgi:exopolyphosphatase/guanosine-5'-triphosphate,3'-diphosphate pyrophosphatase